MQLLSPCSDRTFNCPQKSDEETIFSYTEGLGIQGHVPWTVLQMAQRILNSGDRSGRSCCWKTNGYFKWRNPFTVFLVILKCKKNILLHVSIREEGIKKHGGYVDEQMVKKIFILISYILIHILYIFGVHTQSTERIRHNGSPTCMDEMVGCSPLHVTRISCGIKASSQSLWLWYSSAIR